MTTTESLRARFVLHPCHFRPSPFGLNVTPQILAGSRPATDRQYRETLLFPKMLDVTLAESRSTWKSASENFPDIPRMSDPSRALSCSRRSYAAAVLKTSPR